MLKNVSSIVLIESHTIPTYFSSIRSSVSGTSVRIEYLLLSIFGRFFSSSSINENLSFGILIFMLHGTLPKPILILKKSSSLMLLFHNKNLLIPSGTYSDTSGYVSLKLLAFLLYCSFIFNSDSLTYLLYIAFLFCSLINSCIFLFFMLDRPQNTPRNAEQNAVISPV